MVTKRLAILLLGALVLSHQSYAAEFTVDSIEDDVDLMLGDGVCATVTGQCTLRAAIQETNALNGADTINLPAGTYALTRPSDSEASDYTSQHFLDASGDLDVVDELTILGSGAETTVIDASSMGGRVLHLAPSAMVEMSGLELRGGKDWAGGGVYNDGVLTMNDCIITGNTATLWIFGSPEIIAGGGGIYNTGTLTLNRTTVQGNSATSGGGIQNAGGNVTILGGSLLSNRANGFSQSTIRISGQGGGLANYGGGSTNISGVTIARNQVEFMGGGYPADGAGISNSGQITIVNGTISDNFESRNWPVKEIRNNGQMALNNVTIGELGVGSEGTAQLQNTLIAGPCMGTLQSLGHNLIADTTSCTLMGDSTGNLLDVAPRLGPLQDNGGPTETRALLPGSPAIDAGNATTCEATDQRGMSRPLDGNLDGQAICDIGAYEADGVEEERWLGAAVLPGSRSVPVDSAATAYATILNTGPETATQCAIATTTFVPADFSYQTTDPITNAPIGTPNTPADIASGAGQTFLIAFFPYAEIFSEVVQFQFGCTNTDPAPVIAGVNTFLLSAAPSTPDIIAVNATINNDGIVNIPGETGAGVFAVATTNVGVSADITVSADTGGVTLPVNVLVCETDPTTGACLGDTAPAVTTTIESNETPTFGVFVVGGGTVPFDPASNRIFVRFKNADSVTLGLTSVAVRTLSE